MSKASDFFAGGASGTVLGQVLYLNVKDVDITISGSRYLKSGFLETDLTGIDPSVITDGALFEKEIDNPISGNGAVWEVGSNGTVLRVNGNNVQRSTDNGATWVTSTISLPANYNHQAMATNGTGTWVICQGRGNTGYPPSYKISTNDGVSFSTLSGVPTTGDSQGHHCHYNIETGQWLIWHWSSTTSASSKVCISTDLVAWNSHTVSVIKNGELFIEPCEGNGTWYFHGRTGTASTSYGRIGIVRNVGATFSQISSANGDAHTSGIFSYMYFIGGNLYCGTGPKPGTIYDYSLLYKFPPIPTEYSNYLDTKRYEETDYPDIQTGNSGMYFNGAVYLLSGYITYNGYDLALHDQGNVPNGYYRRTATNLYKALDSLDNDRNHIYKNVPTAGLGTAYRQGSVSQFVKIQEGV